MKGTGIGSRIIHKDNITMHLLMQRPQLKLVYLINEQHKGKGRAKIILKMTVIGSYAIHKENITIHLSMVLYWGIFDLGIF